MKDAFERREGSFKRYYLAEFVKPLMSCYNNFLKIFWRIFPLYTVQYTYTLYLVYNIQLYMHLEDGSWQSQ